LRILVVIIKHEANCWLPDDSVHVQSLGAPPTLNKL